MHKSQPSVRQNGITSPWEPMTYEMKKGLELAAYICRMYSEGDVWSQTILCHSEQVRGRWWMEFDKLNETP